VLGLLKQIQTKRLLLGGGGIASRRKSSRKRKTRKLPCDLDIKFKDSVWTEITTLFNCSAVAAHPVLIMGSQFLAEDQ
jgi:hypothetical protein